MLRANANRLIWRLSDAAVTDALTGLMNRRGFEDLIATELERARRSNQSLSVIIGDLDHFKTLNDTYGHAAGDRALEQLALILDTAKRRIDTAARVGGEEFAVVLPDSDHHAAYILAERMRREVRETFMYEPHRLTISLGVATFPAHADSVDKLVANADRALYAAKSLGRDRTVLYSEQLQPASSAAAAAGEPAAQANRNSSTVRALADVIDARDSATSAHSQTVGRYAAAIARALALPDAVVERVRFSGIVHDVGKIAIPESILSKPGWLSADDWIEMRRHPQIGASILAGADLDDVSEWVLAHHERIDGTGYPHGKAGSEIPLEARILAVADAYEAMTSDRVYRAALAPEEARAELERCAGTQFDRRVVDAFLKVLETYSEPGVLRLVR
jgi:diguanylate cyclase (GGDEF)-like protein